MAVLTEPYALGGALHDRENENAIVIAWASRAIGLAYLEGSGDGGRNRGRGRPRIIVGSGETDCGCGKVQDHVTFALVRWNSVPLLIGG